MAQHNPNPWSNPMPLLEAGAAMMKSALRHVAAGCTAALLATSALVPAHAAGDPLRAGVELNQTSVLAGQSRVIYVRLSLEGLDITPDENRKRAALNVSLVLDRSGSMADEGKMDYLRKAASLAVDRLTPDDTLSVIEYDDQISVMWPARRVRNVAELKSLIEGLEPRGSTNLAGGMIRGVEEAAGALNGPASANGTITRVMLMSDGLANTGITEPREIARLVRDARSKGVRVSAMGLGRDYDEDLMQAIAENGGGRYYYIEHPSQMARIFKDELGTMFETCAQDLDIEFTGSARIRKAEMIGFDDVKPGRALTRDLEDMFEGEKRSILLRLEVDVPPSGTLDLGKLSLRYRTAGTGKAHAVTQDLQVTASTDAGAVGKTLNKSVAADAALAESDRVQKEQVLLYQQGRGDEARRNLSALAKDLEASNRDLDDKRLTQKIEALNVESRQMSEAAASPAAQKDYLKASKQRLYQAKSGKRTGFALQPGDKGREVELLQEALARAGNYKGPIDGIYDDDVTRAVKAYQKANNIAVDGVAGAGTMDKMGLY
jgi:Ca-activated chloride channel family protein